jgi:hypothetical protein
MIETNSRIAQASSDAQRGARAVGSYRERAAAARAAASAARRAEREAWQRRAELSAEVRRLSMAAVKATIRDRGDKLSRYSPAQLRVQADAMIGPWLVVQAKARIAERNSQDMWNSKRPEPQGVLLNETHAQNGAGK